MKITAATICLISLFSAAPIVAAKGDKSGKSTEVPSMTPSAMPSCSKSSKACLRANNLSDLLEAAPTPPKIEELAAGSKSGKSTAVPSMTPSSIPSATPSCSKSSKACLRANNLSDLLGASPPKDEEPEIADAAGAKSGKSTAVPSVKPSGVPSPSPSSAPSTMPSCSKSSKACLRANNLSDLIGAAPPKDEEPAIADAAGAKSGKSTAVPSVKPSGVPSPSPSSRPSPSPSSTPSKTPSTMPSCSKSSKACLPAIALSDLIDNDTTPIVEDASKARASSKSEKSEAPSMMPSKAGKSN